MDLLEAGASLWGAAWGATPPGHRGCRQMSRISAFVGKSRIAGGIKETLTFMPFADCITTSKVIDISQHRIYSTCILVRKRYQQGALK